MGPFPELRNSSDQKWARFRRHQSRPIRRRPRVWSRKTSIRVPGTGFWSSERRRTRDRPRVWPPDSPSPTVVELRPAVHGRAWAPSWDLPAPASRGRNPVTGRGRSSASPCVHGADRRSPSQGAQITPKRESPAYRCRTSGFSVCWAKTGGKRRGRLSSPRRHFFQTDRFRRFRAVFCNRSVEK